VPFQLSLSGSIGKRFARPDAIGLVEIGRN